MGTPQKTSRLSGHDMVHVGGSNYVAISRIVGVFEPSTAAVKRMIREAKVSNKLIDVSRHREVKSILIMDTGDLVTTFLSPEELARRLGRVVDEVHLG